MAYLGLHEPLLIHIRGCFKAPPESVPRIADAEPRIKAEVAIQVEARIKNIHKEIQDSIAEGNPFWTGGPVREAIACDIHKATTEQIEQEMVPVVNELKQQAEDELHQQKKQLSFQCSTRLSEFKDNMWHAAKDWRTKYRNACSITVLREEAHHRGYALTPIDPDALQKEADAFIKYALNPLEINRYELSSLPPSRIPSPDSEAKPSTPPNPSSPLFYADPNVTPTPIRTKRTCTDSSPLPPSSPPPPSPYPYPHPQHAEPNPLRARWLAHVPRQAALPLPPPTPMEEDTDYALEVWADHVVDTNGGLSASLHAPITQPSPIPARNPSEPPQVAVLASMAERPTTAPLPVTLMEAPAILADLVPVPPPAANDGLAALLAAFNATISGLESRLNAKIDAQDKCIEALAPTRDP
ncbi:hypothetical protein EDB86DRAFT_3082448 [Lactarius hatsudake]|nr:hypothetical protein EDB86DRAFT_3082448 [Lactarius hatsudake]